MTVINPESLGAPKGYSNGILAPLGRTLFVSGQIAWDRNHRIVCDDFPGQFAQALRNALEVVRTAGGEPIHVTRLTVFVIDRKGYLDSLTAVGARYRELMGHHFPAMSLVEVRALLEPGAQVEIEATAVLP